ncbi:hypothetical protein [Cardinium endosymbiont of Tipula unca]|uniref:hypothetical protein n=1 Tax=Cardinium endosymbiont of Tipula unca TaxID=3066216 RepID=UPI0030CBBA25
MLFMASHSVHSVNVTVSEDIVQPAIVETQEVVPVDDAYVSPIENYFSLTAEFLGMDYLLNQANPAPLPVKKIDFWCMFRANTAILYAIRINQSRFAFCAGIGRSSLSYSFPPTTHSGGEKTYKTLKRASKSHTACQQIDNVIQLGDGTEITESSFTISYFDVLLRFRFNSVLNEPKEGFHTWLGMKFGFRVGSSTTIGYSEHGESGASLVRCGSFNLNRTHIAIQAGLGYGRFGLTGAYGLNPLFDKGQGPNSSDVVRPLSIGFYVDLL